MATIDPRTRAQLVGAADDLGELCKRWTVGPWDEGRVLHMTLAVVGADVHLDPDSRVAGEILGAYARGYGFRDWVAVLPAPVDRSCSTCRFDDNAPPALECGRCDYDTGLLEWSAKGAS